MHRGYRRLQSELRTSLGKQHVGRMVDILLDRGHGDFTVLSGKLISAARTDFGTISDVLVLRVMRAGHPSHDIAISGAIVSEITDWHSDTERFR